MNENNVFTSESVLSQAENVPGPTMSPADQPIYQVSPGRRQPILPIILLILALILIALGIWRLVSSSNNQKNESDPEIVELDLAPVISETSNQTPVISDEPTDLVPVNTLTTRPNLVENNTTTNLKPTQVVTSTNTVVKEVVKERKSELRREPRLETCGNRHDNLWSAKFIFPEVKDADDYWVIIGTVTGSNDVLEKHLPGRHEQYLFIDLENDKDYYVKYSVRINGTYTEFSQILQAKCRGGSHNNSKHDSWSGYYGDFKGFRCIKDTHTCESTNDDNPPYSNTEAGLNKCAQDCR